MMVKSSRPRETGEITGHGGKRLKRRSRETGEITGHGGKKLKRRPVEIGKITWTPDGNRLRESPRETWWSSPDLMTTV